MEIMMDECEMLDSHVSDDTLRFISKLNGPKVKDSLLIPKDDDG